LSRSLIHAHSALFVGDTTQPSRDLCNPDGGRVPEQLRPWPVLLCQGEALLLLKDFETF
jgi:hypothetical protein